MSAFLLRLLCPVRAERIDDVISFVGRDASGSFGILANAFRRVTVLSYGMASIRRLSGQVEYLALPGGTLTFVRGELTIATTGFVRSAKIEEIEEALQRRVRLEGENIREIKLSLRRLDEEILRRFSEIGRRRAL